MRFTLVYRDNFGQGSYSSNILIYMFVNTRTEQRFKFSLKIIEFSVIKILDESRWDGQEMEIGNLMQLTV